jgi:SAM-dependent methyltransferase
MLRPVVVGVTSADIAQREAMREYIRARMRKEAPFRAYQAMARAYDAFTAHEDHESWLGELMPHLERRGLVGNRLLDVGCGTGKSLIPMFERGWRVSGYDISPRMLAFAREKVGDVADLRVADMRNQPHVGYFDLVWAVNDAMNYLLSEWALRDALSGMRRNLAIGGLLVFDLNTIRAYRTVFAKGRIVKTNGPNLIWTGFARPSEPPGSECEALFEIEGRGTDFSRVHRQRHFPEAVALGCIAEAGLECLDVLGQEEGGALVQPLDEIRHRKAIYIARDRDSAWGRFEAEAIEEGS